ncbi:MAG: MBL fold metallo-hydrolase, partial [Oligoflexales bacterium]|nr:MBL fold metallo-hydrolase [Oligoflexales bacterium]
MHFFSGQIEMIYLAEYPDRILLLDGGCCGDLDKITKFVAGKLNRSISDIKLSLVSHPHPDHVGVAQLLRERFGIPIAAHETIDTWYQGLGGYFQHIVDMFHGEALSLKFDREIMSIKSKRVISPDFPLKDGDKVPGFPDWNVLHCPGHTAHDLV